MVERFNHTLVTLLERRVRSDKGISLQQAVRTKIYHYNRRPGSVFRFRWAPRQVHDDAPDPALVWRNDLRVKWLLRRRPVETPKRRFKFAVGDYVCLLECQSVFDNAYQGNYTQEVFRMEECKWVALYRVEDLAGEDVRGWFYEAELARVPLPDKHVKTTVSRKKKSRVVTLEDYPAPYTEEVSLPLKRQGRKRKKMT